MRLFFISTLLLALFNSCWNQQGHNASGPELPNYTVSGTVFSSDSHEPVTGATVTIGTSQTTTDSMGQYSIFEVLGGKDHSISVNKTGYATHNAGFQLGFADLESLDVVLSRILYVADLIEAPGNEPNGITWVDDVPWASCQWGRRMYMLDAAQGLSEITYVDSPGSFPQKDIYTTPYGITATEEGGEWFLWISVAFDDGTASVYKTTALPDGTLNTVARYDTPETQYSPDVIVVLDDLAYDGTNIWSCSARERRIYKHGTDMSVLSVFDVVDYRPRGIAWAGEVLLMTTDSSNELYLLSGENLEPMGYYVLYETSMAGLSYRNGYLWTCKHGSQSQQSYFFTYRIDSSPLQ